MQDATDMTDWLNEPETSEGDAPNNHLIHHVGDGSPVHAAPVEPSLKPPDPAEMTDEWHARRFVDLHAARLRYHKALGGWIAYDGKRWRNDESVTAERLARDSIQLLRRHLPTIGDKYERRDFESAIRRAESSRTVGALLGLARSDDRLKVAPSDFDAHPFLFNCLNGTIDLRTGRLRPHDPADLLTKLASVNYVPDAACPLWEAALRLSMNDDAEIVAFLCRAAGYSLTGDTSEHCMFLLYGTGRNGKTLMLTALLGVVGDYGMMAPNHLLTTSGRTQHLTAVADLDGMRLVGISEPAGGRFDDAQMKSLTGGESIRANRMHCNYFEFAPTYKLFMASNHKPVTGEFNTAFWRRIKFIDFAVTIQVHQQDRDMPAKLKAESEGILAWMVRGCLEWQKEGLNEPEVVRQATQGYRDEMDPISGFLDACCDLEETLRVRSSSLWAAYKEWCNREGISPGERIANDTTFGRLLTQKGFKVKRTSRGNDRLGLRLKPSPEVDPDCPI